ncbi:MAG: 4'-phosphopantetheinyl transferase superfamily protein [Myxococcota bacterium]
MARTPDMPLAAGDVAVWFQRVGEAAAARAPAYLELLSRTERESHDRHRPSARLEFLTAHALVRRALSRHAAVEPSAWRFEVDDQGRPQLQDPPPQLRIDFNLSHTEGLVACAVTRSGQVGVDVECLDEERDVARIARRILGPCEQRWLQGLDDATRGLGLLDCWTLKEAHLKALGTGIRSPLSGLEFEIGPGQAARLLSGPVGSHAPTDWRYLRSAPTPRHRLSAAMPCAEEPHWHLAEFPA